MKINRLKGQKNAIYGHVKTTGECQMAKDHTKETDQTAISMADIEKELAELQEITTASEVGTSDGYMTVRHGNMAIRDIPVPDNKINVVVVGSIIEYAYYESAYDPDNVQMPVCFANGLNEKELKPHEFSTKKQSDNCLTCPKNRFGSAPNGKGKACKNSRKLALMGSFTDIDSIATADIVFFKIPVTSVKNWSQYILELSSKKLSMLHVITRISSKSHPKTQVAVSFEQEQLIPKDFLGALLARHKEVQSRIATIYKPRENEANHTTEVF